ncbi:uncharacterized protein LOC130714795 [Lotus japonicus]|uniref:uncharacterized protein LOC130714795 n=1 Tax=Lotus japonicus TaxID=34305 RepID=UPI00258284A3|nr:uncharacterized protein LOC130714795 [Lotus japonicus]
MNNDQVLHNSILSLNLPSISTMHRRTSVVDSGNNYREVARTKKKFRTNPENPKKNSKAIDPNRSAKASSTIVATSSIPHLQPKPRTQIYKRTQEPNQEPKGVVVARKCADGGEAEREICCDPSPTDIRNPHLTLQQNPPNHYQTERQRGDEGENPTTTDPSKSHRPPIPPLLIVSRSWSIRPTLLSPFVLNPLRFTGRVWISFSSHGSDLDLGSSKI